MTIPSSSLYPDSFDSDQNLYLVHDSLRVQLLEDYNPGDAVITVTGDITNFPPSGLITLTEQCSDIENRAIAFYYGFRTATTFNDLELLPSFTDSFKPQRVTNVVENVMAEHHEAIKNAIIAIEEFAGIKGTVDLTPLGDTMTGRVGFLEKLVLRPRAWFSADKTVGVIPLNVTFTDLSFRNPLSWEWCFGDNDVSVMSLIPSVTSVVPSGTYCVDDTDGGKITKSYYTPGIYDVSLTVTNAYGTDTIVIPSMINARAEAPSEATMEFTNIDQTKQVLTTESNQTGGVIKSKINTLITIEVTDNGQQTNDPITQYIWKLSDNLLHVNSIETNALYDIGGLYDVKLRCNSEFGSYRTTVVTNAIDIIEDYNLWYSNFSSKTYASSKSATTYEFGLISETFKTTNRSALSNVARNYSFLSDTQQKEEFLRNNGFNSKNVTNSGSRGTAFLYWATGYDTGTQSWTDQNIQFMEYESFSDCYAVPSNPLCNASLSGTIARAWNWVSLDTLKSTYFLLGNTNSAVGSSTNQTLSSVNLSSLTPTNTTLGASNYLNGASELMVNVEGGQFSVYRSTWWNSTGFIARNDATGVYFRIKNFYQTQGILSNTVQNLSKLADLPGTVKTECQLASLSSGVYVFNNSGEVLVYTPTNSTWFISGPGINSVSFGALQDATVNNYSDQMISGAPVVSFDDGSQRLMVASDQERRAYLSFDYSSKTFIKYNEATNSFNSLVARPDGEQFIMGVY